MDGGMISKAILGDCMDVMRKYPDKYFDLAVVDGQLNPEWVEWLMGFPAGWSELEPSAMWSYRSRHTRSSARSRKN